MTVSTVVYKGQKPTASQIEEIRAAKLLTPVYDDAPALTQEQMVRYREAALKRKNKNAVTIQLSDDDYKTAIGFGDEYRSILSELVAVAIHDPDILNSVISR